MMSLVVCKKRKRESCLSDVSTETEGKPGKKAFTGAELAGTLILDCQPLEL